VQLRVSRGRLDAHDPPHEVAVRVVFVERSRHELVARDVLPGREAPEHLAVAPDLEQVADAGRRRLADVDRHVEEEVVGHDRRAAAALASDLLLDLDLLALAEPYVAARHAVEWADGFVDRRVLRCLIEAEVLDARTLRPVGLEELPEQDTVSVGADDRADRAAERAADCSAYGGESDLHHYASSGCRMRLRKRCRQRVSHSWSMTWPMSDDVCRRPRPTPVLSMPTCCAMLFDRQ